MQTNKIKTFLFNSVSQPIHGEHPLQNFYPSITGNSEMKILSNLITKMQNFRFKIMGRNNQRFSVIYTKRSSRRG